MSELALFGGPKALTHSDELAQMSCWPKFGEEEKTAVLSAMEGDVYAPIAPFETEFRNYIGTQYAVATNNGTSAIHSAYFAAGVGPGDEVIVSPHTWHLQCSQILALHGIPVFCDVDPLDASMDPADIERRISDRTRAISVVHPYGAVADMDPIMDIARAHGLKVIEDCSHAHGATYKGRKVGSIGDIGCFSLQASKLMTAIEAGIMVTDDVECFERAILLGHYERVSALPDEKYNRFVQPQDEQAPTCFGFKYRMNPMAAALARVQLKHLDAMNATRRRNNLYIADRLATSGAGVITPPYERPGTQRTWLNFICNYHEETAGVPRERYIEAVQAEGLAVTGGRAGYLPVYWNPLYEQRVSMWGPGYPFDAPAVTHKVSYDRGICPEAERIWKRGVNVPIMHWEASEALLDEVIEALVKPIRHIDELK